MPRSGNHQATGRKVHPTKRQHARQLLLAGKDVEEVAREVGVGRDTVFRWRNEPEFARRLEAHREALLKTIEDNNVADVRRALQVRREIMDNAGVKPEVRLKAAESILSMAMETRKNSTAAATQPTRITAEDWAAVRRHYEEELRAAGWAPPVVLLAEEMKADGGG